MSKPLAPLLVELERHVASKLAKIGDPPCGCIVLLAIELGSANAALEGIGVEGTIDVGGAPVRIGQTGPVPALNQGPMR